MCVTLHTNVQDSKTEVCEGRSERVRIAELFMPVITIIAFYFLEVSRFKLEIPQVLEEEVTSSGGREGKHSV